MRILMSGASGLIGRGLSAVLRQSGHEVAKLVRRAPDAGEVQWRPGEALDAEKLAGFDAVIHLAGKNVAGLWTEKFKREVHASRVVGTDTLAEAAAESCQRNGRPGIFLCASATGYYGNRGADVLTEENAPGKGFLAETCVAWEAAAQPARDAGLRVVNVRIGVVLAKDGGALKPLLPPFKLGLGGRIGDGRQFWSWVSLDDVVGTFVFALEKEQVRGPVNAVSPQPARNAEFVKALGRVLHRPTIFPLPAWVIRLAMREMGEEMLLTSARVEPAKLLAAGYRFQHPDLEEALQHALK